MSAGTIFALLCGFLALAYGVWSVKWILALPDGNDRMREIAAAVQEGAQAYLNRQYATIGLVGAVLAVILFSFSIPTPPSASSSVPCCPGRPATSA